MKRKKTVKQLWETSYPFVLALLMFVISFLIKKNFNLDVIWNRLFDGETMTVIITIESILIGFVLTILAFIIQINNKALDLIKEFKMYDRLICFGKNAIYSALIVVVISFLIFLIFPISKYEWLQYIWIFAITCSTLSIYRFIKIFFVIAKSA